MRFTAYRSLYRVVVLVVNMHALGLTPQGSTSQAQTFVVKKPVNPFWPQQP